MLFLKQIYMNILFKFVYLVNLHQKFACCWFVTVAAWCCFNKLWNPSLKSMRLKVVIVWLGETSLSLVSR
jgi:hypothetical protein